MKYYRLTFFCYSVAGEPDLVLRTSSAEGNPLILTDILFRLVPIFLQSFKKIEVYQTFVNDDLEDIDELVMSAGTL